MIVFFYMLLFDLCALANIFQASQYAVAFPVLLILHNCFSAMRDMKRYSIVT